MNALCVRTFIDSQWSFTSWSSVSERWERGGTSPWLLIFTAVSDGRMDKAWAIEAIGTRIWCKWRSSSWIIVLFLIVTPGVLAIRVQLHSCHLLKFHFNNWQWYCLPTLLPVACMSRPVVSSNQICVLFLHYSHRTQSRVLLGKSGHHMVFCNPLLHLAAVQTALHTEESLEEDQKYCTLSHIPLRKKMSCSSFT